MTAPGGHGASETKKATINGLAVVGFGALILGGILLALYAARYVPDALSRLSSAVYLSAEKPENADETATTTPQNGNGFFLFPSRDTSASDTNEEEPVVDDSSTEDTSDEEASSDEETDAPQTGGPLYVAPRPVYVPQQPQLYGLPDLELFDVRGGYFRGSTFVESDDVPNNRDAGIKFTVINTGTNIASGWRVEVKITGERTAIATGGALRPDGYQNFTLRVTDSDEETLRVSIDVDPSDRVNESDERNNDDTLRLDLD